MRKSIIIAPLAVLAFASTATAQTVTKSLLNGASALPSQTCAVTQAELNSWKTTNSNTSVSFKPPPSDSFPTDNTLCDFYQWAAQAFLWATSLDANGDYNFIGSDFLNVVAVGNGNFVLEPNTAGTTNKIESKLVFGLRDAKPTDVGEVGQAGGGGVLMSQGQSLVYYAIHANDVFGALWQKQASVPYYQTTPDFPTSAAQVAQIATTAGTTFPDASAMAVEMKTSWVDASTLDPQVAAGMIKISAQVPNFVKSGNNLVWSDGTYLDKTLALVGMHMVGSVVGHPELIWATFEHYLNTEDNTYSYVDTGNNLQTVSFNSNAPSTTFFKSGTTLATANTETMKAATTSSASGLSITISPTGSTPIGPISTVRVNPWGNVQPATPTTTDEVTVNNTLLLSLAVSLDETLATAGVPGLVRASYVQTGAIWTDGGVIPTFSGTPAVTLEGSTMLANSTMETFFQNAGNQLQCFDCHSVGSSTSPGTDVSHIFPNIVSPITVPATK